MPQKKYNKNIIIALDYTDPKDAVNIVKKLDYNLCRLKIGKALFTAAGPDLIKNFQDKGFDIFLDLKFHDIPNTVYNACLVAADLGVWMLTVHTFGGLEMLKAAKQGTMASSNIDQPKPMIMGVTLLTSIDNLTLHSLGIVQDIDSQVLKLASFASEARLDGVVCSGLEAKMLKDKFSSLKLVTPGIRMPVSSGLNLGLNSGLNSDDQKRIMTPKQAIEAGSDYLVIGREITGAPDPIAVLENIIASIS